MGIPKVLMETALATALPLCMQATTLGSDQSVVIETSSVPQAYAPVKWSQKSVSNTPSALEATEWQLMQTIIPEVDFRDASLPEALSFLQRKTGVPMIVIPDGKSGQSPQSLTLQLKGKSATESLRYIAALTGLKQRTEPGAVILTPLVACNMPQMISMEIPLAAWIDRKTFEEKKLIEILTANGVPFPPGSSLHYDSSKGCIIVHTTELAFDHIAEVWPALTDVTPWPSEKEQARFRRALYLQRVEAWEKALSETSVLHAEIRNASMEEIATVLRTKVSPWVGIQADPDVRVTFSVKGGSFLELIQKIAEESHTRLILGWQSVVFVSAVTVD